MIGLEILYVVLYVDCVHSNFMNLDINYVFLFTIYLDEHNQQPTFSALAVRDM
jgi:hypothetical protein